jgi:hypothetical protein
MDAYDPRDLLNDKKFDNIEVTDIITLDEISIRDYLQKSKWNIVIKADQAYYGFERNTLIECLYSKPVIIDGLGKFYKTPFNQCITLEALNMLRFSEYSIYELKSAYSVVESGGRVDSLFNMHCYSVKQWVEGAKGTNIIVPPQPLVTSSMSNIIHSATYTHNISQTINVSMDDILAAVAHLLVPGNLEAFHAAVREIHGEV